MEKFANRILADLLKERIGRSREEALLAELRAKIRQPLPKGLDIGDVVEIFCLDHWFRHYKKGNKFWLRLDGEEQPVVCLEVNPVERCMVVLDRRNRRREVHLDSKEVIDAVEDPEGRRIRRLTEALERLEQQGKALEKRQANLQKQLEVTKFKLAKQRRAAARLREGVAEIKNQYDKQRHMYTTALQKRKEELNDILVAAPLTPTSG